MAARGLEAGAVASREGPRAFSAWSVGRQDARLRVWAPPAIVRG